MRQRSSWRTNATTIVVEDKCDNHRRDGKPTALPRKTQPGIDGHTPSARRRRVVPTCSRDRRLRRRQRSASSQRRRAVCEMQYDLPWTGGYGSVFGPVRLARNTSTPPSAGGRKVLVQLCDGARPRLVRAERRCLVPSASRICVRLSQEAQYAPLEGYHVTIHRPANLLLPREPHDAHSPWTAADARTSGGDAKSGSVQCVRNAVNAYHLRSVCTRCPKRRSTPLRALLEKLRPHVSSPREGSRERVRRRPHAESVDRIRTRNWRKTDRKGFRSVSSPRFVIDARWSPQGPACALPAGAPSTEAEPRCVAESSAHQAQNT